MLWVLMAELRLVFAHKHGREWTGPKELCSRQVLAWADRDLFIVEDLDS